MGLADVSGLVPFSWERFIGLEETLDASEATGLDLTKAENIALTPDGFQLRPKRGLFLARPAAVTTFGGGPFQFRDARGRERIFILGNGVVYAADPQAATPAWTSIFTFETTGNQGSFVQYRDKVYAMNGQDRTRRIVLNADGTYTATKLDEVVAPTAAPSAVTWDKHFQVAIVLAGAGNLWTAEDTVTPDAFKFTEFDASGTQSERLLLEMTKASGVIGKIIGLATQLSPTQDWREEPYLFMVTTAADGWKGQGHIDIQLLSGATAYNNGTVQAKAPLFSSSERSSYKVDFEQKGNLAAINNIQFRVKQDMDGDASTFVGFTIFELLVPGGLDPRVSHRWAYSYYNPTLNQESRLGPVTADMNVPQVGEERNRTATVTCASSGNATFKIRLYRLVPGDTYHMVDQKADPGTGTVNFTDYFTDETLVAGGAFTASDATSQTRKIAQLGDISPPPCRFGVVYKDRVIWGSVSGSDSDLSKRSPSEIRISNFQDPETVPTVQQFDAQAGFGSAGGVKFLAREDGQAIEAMVVGTFGDTGETLVVGKTTSVWSMTGDAWDTFRWDLMLQGYGPQNSRSFLALGGALYMLSQWKLWRIAPQSLDWISEKIDFTPTGTMTYQGGALGNLHNTVLVAVPTVSGGVNDRIYSLDTVLPQEASGGGVAWVKWTGWDVELFARNLELTTVAPLVYWLDRAGHCYSLGTALGPDVNSAGASVNFTATVQTALTDFGDPHARKLLREMEVHFQGSSLQGQVSVMDETDTAIYGPKNLALGGTGLKIDRFQPTNHAKKLLALKLTITQNLAGANWKYNRSIAWVQRRR